MSRGSSYSHWRKWRPWLPLCVGILGLSLVLPSRLGETLARSSYDWLHQLTGLNRTALADTPVLLLYLDRDTFEALNPPDNQRLPREVYARLLDRLTRAGARAVVLDILFSSPGPDPAADEVFAAAIRRNGRVVLGAAVSGSTSEQTELLRSRAIQLELPIHPLATNAAAVGLTGTAIDNDFGSRRHFAGLPSLGYRSLAYATADLVGATDRTAAGDGRWLRYYGPPFALPHLSLHRALSDLDVGDEVFRDRIVFVGARPAPGRFGERGDELRNPFVALTEPDQFMPGVEVHATQTMNLLRGDALRRTGPGAEAIAWLCFGIIVSAVLLRWRPAHALPVALALAAGVAGLALLALARGNVWCAWLIPVFVQTPAAIVGGLTLHTIDWWILRRQNEARIREQAELIDKAQDAILLFDLAGKLQLANPRARELYELSRNGGDPIDFNAEPARTAQRTVLANGQWQGEMTRARATSTNLVLASRWTLIRDASGTPTGILVIDTDVTEQKQLEAQLIRAQRMEAVGAVAGGMAHDLNNALAPVLMGVQLLRKRNTDEATHNTLEQVEASARRGAEMVRQVLSFARGHDRDCTRLDAGVLVHEMSRLARETFPRNIRIETRIASDLWPIEGNATQLHQVLLNLCINARDALPGGGTLTLAADNVWLSAEEVTEIPNARVGDFVSILVNDTGTGIPPEQMARLFEPFFTTKPEGRGTGLGLPMVKRLVEGHGGFLRVESKVGEGTTFECFLPRAPLTPQAAPDEEPQEWRGGGESILVIDDAGGARELLGEALTGRGFQVLTTGSASEALERIAAGTWRPAALVMDLNLPGVGGRDVLSAIRRHLPGIPALLLSTSAPTPADDLPASTRIQLKPAAVQTTLVAIRELLATVATAANG